MVEQNRKIQVDCVLRLILGATDISLLDFGRARLPDSGKDISASLETASLFISWNATLGVLWIELFPERDSVFRSKLSHQNIAGATASKLFDWIGNDCKDLIERLATSACTVSIRVTMSGEMQSHYQYKHCIGTFSPVGLCSPKAIVVYFKVRNFPLEITNNKSSLKDIDVRLVESNAPLWCEFLEDITSRKKFITVHGGFLESFFSSLTIGGQDTSVAL